MLQKNRSELQDFSTSIQDEWLETNGLGGWSSSTVIGCNTRRYHGLLVAATNPPAERMSLLSKLDETIIAGSERYELDTNNYGSTISPNGYKYLTGFARKLFPEFIYEINGIQLKKTIAMIHGENTVVICYEVLQADKSFQMELVPLLSGRNYHGLMRYNQGINSHAIFENGTLRTKSYDITPELFLKVPGSSFQHKPDWYYNFNYIVEAYRGLDFVEDLFTPGTFTIDLKEGDYFGIVISTSSPDNKDAKALLISESRRRQLLLKDQPTDELTTQLILAADQFIVKRGEDLKTIIAGYHWFTDWGRDTMISLTGLCLCTGRYEDARKILAAFAKTVSMGMLPNRFQDNGEAPEYNNVDGTLWYFIAVYKYLRHTNDKQFVLETILPVLKEIIDWHFKGTRYNIHVDEDGLLFAGEAGQQLTWMDARIGSWVVTPRMGKPVEIQALWYNALKIFSGLLDLTNQNSDAFLVNISAEKAKESFIEKFWNGNGNYLFDVIEENGNAVTELRPNQLFAISLPFALIEGEKAKLVLENVREQLYTPVGLRTLPVTDVHYTPVYGGDTFHRDSSYHEGTVWSWLLGPYTDAIMKVYGSKEKAQEVIKNFRYHLNEGCIGSVSEIFDADSPHHPRGCVAQAWGVAEVLRVIKDYELYRETKPQLRRKPRILMQLL